MGTYLVSELGCSRSGKTKKPGGIAALASHLNPLRFLLSDRRFPVAVAHRPTSVENPPHTVLHQAGGDAIAAGFNVRASAAVCHSREAFSAPFTMVGMIVQKETGKRGAKALTRQTNSARIALFSLVAATCAAVSSAHAFDDKIFDDNTGGVRAESSPWAVFQFGFSAYKSGHKDQAVEAYRYAAENGQIGATWKLARMYAEGDGVDRNDYEAYKFFREIADQDVEPGSPEESYVSDALVALGAYSKKGIPGSPIAADPAAAQEFYMRAAANYRNPAAQYEMGKMFLRGDGGVKTSVRQAGRWLQLAAEKGHAGAQATLGNLLFQSGKVVRGLAMMTAALERASPTDRVWIRGMQEEAFSLAAEADRRTAISLAEDILTKGQ
jgi:TPR repeat protein